MRRTGLALLALLLVAGGAEAARGLPTQASLARVGSRHVSLNGVRVREEGHPAQMRGEGAFITPNEAARVFAPALRGRAASGSVLAVGSFRGLEDAAYALEGVAGLPRNFHLIQLDADVGMTRFNLANASALAHSESRQSYGDDLVSVAPTERWVKGTGWRKLAPVALAGRSPRERSRALIAASLDAATPIADPLGSYLETLGREPAEAAHTILGDDARFATVRGLARAGRVRPVNGSLIGTRTMRDLGSALRARGERLSVIDLSNAGDWIASGRGGDLKGDLLRLADNLEALPLADDAIVLLTTERDAWSRTFDPGVPQTLTVGWAYHAIPARDLVRVLRAPDPTQGWGNPRWGAMFDASTARASTDDGGLRRAR